MSFSSSAAHRDLHSFPTRRSSDLKPCQPYVPHRLRCHWRVWSPSHRNPAFRRLFRWVLVQQARPTTPLRRHSTPPKRSEEHTSELQSQSNLVCRLLLEKNKKKTRK